MDKNYLTEIYKMTFDDDFETSCAPFVWSICNFNYIAILMIILSNLYDMKIIKLKES